MTELQAFLYALHEPGAWINSNYTQQEPWMEAAEDALRGTKKSNRSTELDLCLTDR